MIHPTPYGELNLVLAHLLDGARARLGDNFIGLYLQGSFAVGDSTPWSDCDFIIVTRRDITLAELPAFQTLHAEIHELPAPYWRNGLEGSYVPADILRRRSVEPRDPPGEPRGPDWTDPGLSDAPPRAYPFWYLDHGAKVLVRSEHDNTHVVRWCLREKGVALAGPPITSLVDPVPASVLKAEVRETLDLILSLGLEPMHLLAWQAFWVGLACRILHTLETGRVTSKKEATTWAAAALGPRWAPLIRDAAAMKKGDDRVALLPVSPQLRAETHAFVRHAAEVADRAAST